MGEVVLSLGVQEARLHKSRRPSLRQLRRPSRNQHPQLPRHQIKLRLQERQSGKRLWLAYSLVDSIYASGQDLALPQILQALPVCDGRAA